MTWHYNILLRTVKKFKKQIKQRPDVNIYQNVSGLYKSDIINIEPI